MAPEQHLHDLTIEREQRRSQQGYVTPADARAVLQMARRSAHTKSAVGTPSNKSNPIVAAYFLAAGVPSTPLSFAGSHSSEVPGQDGPESLDAVIELLSEAGMMPRRPLALLDASDADPHDDELSILRPLMAYARDTHDEAYFIRTRELVFLANTLLVGCSIQSRYFTVQEASVAAASICNLGLEHWPARWSGKASLRRPSRPPDSFLVEHDLLTAFEVGWSVLHQEVSLFVAKELISTIDSLHFDDRDIERGLVELRRTLAEQRDAGTPWRARDAAEILAMLDTTAWISVLGLLDECPVVPAALSAVVQGRTTGVSPTEFDFISTSAQIDDIQTFMRKLPSVLSR
jgi:hypothetical protein